VGAQQDAPLQLPGQQPPLAAGGAPIQNAGDVVQQGGGRLN